MGDKQSKERNESSDEQQATAKKKEIDLSSEGQQATAKKKDYDVNKPLREEQQTRTEYVYASPRWSTSHFYITLTAATADETRVLWIPLENVQSRYPYEDFLCPSLKQLLEEEKAKEFLYSRHEKRDYNLFQPLAKPQQRSPDSWYTESRMKKSNILEQPYSDEELSWFFRESSDNSPVEDYSREPMAGKKPKKRSSTLEQPYLDEELSWFFRESSDNSPVEDYSREPMAGKKPKEYLVYVAVEVGTTFCGYSYVFARDNINNINGHLDKITIKSGNWKFGPSKKLMTYTTVLLSPDGKFHSLGFEAEQFYYNNPKDVNFDNWFFFKQLKSVLNDQNTLTENTAIEDHGGFGNKIKAVDVVAAVLDGLIENLFKQLSGNVELDLSVSTIHWTLTVPALWTKGGKQFMLDAAAKSGIPGDQLTLLLEPEAAFWYCKNMSSKHLRDRMDIVSDYIVLHLSGKSTLITIHEGIDPSSLKRVYETCGGDVVCWEFVKFLTRIIGWDVVHQLRTYHAEDFFKFTSSARSEICKSEEKFNGTTNIKLPIKLKNAIRSLTGKSLTNLINNSQFAGQVTLMMDKLTIQKSVAHSFFNVFIRNVLNTLEEVLNCLPMYNMHTNSALIGIGEYEESYELPLLVNALKNKFPQLNVIVPNTHEFAVLRGAISYGIQTMQTANIFSPSNSEQVKSVPLLSRLPQMNSKDFKTLIAKGSYASYENRVYLAGACNVGKTCLASILIGEKIPRKWFSTDGLTIYFGKNGIHLKEKKMIPLTKTPVETSIVQKLLLGNPELNTEKKPQVTDEIQVVRLPNVDDEVIEFERDNLRPAYTSEPQNDCEEKREVENQDQLNFTPEEHMPTRVDDQSTFFKNHRAKKKIKTSTLNIIQQTPASIHEDILQQLRNGKYKVEIALSDLVDFGGQRTYDMTHQLFIQQQGTFVLMIDGRYGLHQPLKEYREGAMTAKDILVHWVNSILLYCKDDDDIMPMILFAATHRDLMETDVFEEKRKLTHALAQLFKSHVKNKHIMYDRIFFINATDSKDQEIGNLKDTLVDIAFKQSSWGRRMPLAWVPLELQITEMRSKNISLIPKGKLQELNLLNKEFTLSEFSIEEFLKMQHSFGKIMYFDTPGVNNFIVIQPTAMVNILRSFVTDKYFWPTQKELNNILESISSTGKVRKEQLFRIWSQPQFEEFAPTTEHMEYLIQVLIHLDILVEPQHKYRRTGNDCTYFVPCVVQKNLPADLLPYDGQKTICLAYHLRESLIPSALTFKLIAAPVTVWPLRKINGRHCLYFQSAILKIDDSNQLLIVVRGQRVIVYLSNKISKHFISPDVAASIQEYLTSALQRVLYFYHECFGKRFVKMGVSSLFETEVGMICREEICLVPLEVARKNQEWPCKCFREYEGQTYESKYSLYWVFDKEKKRCQPECKGLEADALLLPPNDKHLVRLAEQIGITVFDQFIIHLGLTREEWENIEYEYTRNGSLGIKLMALYECEKMKQKLNQTLSLHDLSVALNGIDRPHSLCQIVREETNLMEVDDRALQETPTDEILNRLPRQLGNCVIQLGIELGLSFNSIEETMYNYSKDMYSQLYDILKKWKQYSVYKPSVYTLMKALQRIDAGGLDFLRVQYRNF